MWQGKYTFDKGEVYEGDYFKGKRQGYGKYTYADGTVFQGACVCVYVRVYMRMYIYIYINVYTCD